RLIHGAVTIIDRSDLVLRASGIALGPKITRCLAERTLDNSFVRYQHSLDDDLRVGRNQKILAEGFRRCEAERLAQITANDVVLTHFERPAVARAHVECGVMTEYGRDGHFLVPRLIIAIDLPQVTRRSIEGGGVLRLHLHAMVRTIVDPAFLVFGYSG